MSSPGRRLAMILPVAVTVLLAGVIGVLVTVQGQQQNEQVAEADAVGEAFLSDVGTFETRVTRELKKVTASDPAALRAVLDRVIAKPPTLKDAPNYGAQQSGPYISAVELEETFLEPYQDLSRELRRADVARTFIKAAREVLELRATDYVGFGPIGNSGQVRNRLIPAFVAARDTFVSVRVPTGQDELAATVRDAAQFVIDQATRLAASIDANESFSFSYSEEFGAAADAVDGYATTVSGDLTEAINAVTGTR